MTRIDTLVGPGFITDDFQSVSDNARSIAVKLLMNELSFVFRVVRQTGQKEALIFRKSRNRLRLKILRQTFRSVQIKAG